MDTVYIIYWSGTGNTAAMASAIADGAKEGGANIQLLSVEEANTDDIVNAKALALGCPSMGSEQLEESEMEPFMSELDKLISGKTICLFGSYGWGDGEWMREWESRIVSDGAVVLNGNGIISNDAPTDDVVEELRKSGKSLSALVL